MLLIVLSPLSLGQNATCTITNDDVAPTLTIVKAVVNDNGGTALVSDFNLYISGTAVTSGQPNTLAAGVQYLVSEDSLSGYTASDWGGDCASDGTITLSLGQNATCTITNDDVAPTLTIVKAVVNDNGGTALVSDFNLYISGTAVTSGQANTLAAGVQYLVSEDSLSGYTASAWGGDCASDGTITLSLGQNATCTITNYDVAVTVVSPVTDLFARAKDGKIDIVWTHVGAPSYNVYRSDGGGAYSFVANTSSTYSVYADFGLTNGVEYCYIVRSVDAPGTGSR